MRCTRNGLLQLLQVFNWGLFAIFGVSAACWFAVCLMMIPYPRLVAESGANMADVYTITAIFMALTAISAAAAWLLRRRHALQWAGQAVLVLAITGMVGWTWFGI